MARVVEQDVRDILDNDIGDTSQLPSLVPFISAATLIVTRAMACAERRKKAFTAAEAKECERWLAAYYAVHKSPQYKLKSTSGAGGSFDHLSYLDAACNMDPSGCLQAIIENKVASGAWLGKRPSVQTPYRERS